MRLKNGTIYRFVNDYHDGYGLNIYGTGTGDIKGGQNVCLYPARASDKMQQWKAVNAEESGTFRLCAVLESNYVLDCSDGSIATSYKNNAHMCKGTGTSDEDCAVEIETVEGDMVMIRLSQKDLYLTATSVAENDAELSNNISTSAALRGGSTGKGNVYWKSGASEGSMSWKKQCWHVIEVSGGSEPEPEPEPEPGDQQKLCLPLNNTTINTGYKQYAPGYNLKGKPAIHYGVDLIGGTFSGENDKRFFASGKGKVLGFNTVYKEWSGYTVGRWLAIKYYNVENFGDLVVRYFHLDAVDSDIYVGKEVDRDTIIGTMGSTGDYCYGRHLHVEVDRDTEGWEYSPTLSGATQCGLKAGATGAGDTTLNPLDVFKVKKSEPENQKCYVENDGVWCDGITIPESF